MSEKSQAQDSTDGLNAIPKFKGGEERLSPPASSEIRSLVTEWIGSHSDLFKRMLTLALADARLAAVSGVQLASLALVFAIVFVCLLMVTAAATVIFLMWLGMSMGVSVAVILLLLISILGLLFIAIRATYEDLRFKATRKSIFGATEKFEAIPDHENPDNQ